MLGFNNSNALVRDERAAGTSSCQKTGYIREAGKCLVMLANIGSRPFVIVLLDSLGRYTRLGDAQRVRHWLETGEGMPLPGQKASTRVASAKPAHGEEAPAVARTRRRLDAGARRGAPRDALTASPGCAPAVRRLRHRVVARSPAGRAPIGRLAGRGHRPASASAARSSFRCGVRPRLGGDRRAGQHPRQLLDARGGVELA